MTAETLIPEVLDAGTKSEVERLESWTQSVSVTCPEQREEVYKAIQEVKGVKGRIVAFFKPSKDHAFAAHRAIVANEKSFTDRLDKFEVAGKRAIMSYDEAENQKRLAEQRRLQAIADEQARKEREKQAQEAEKQRRIEQEARDKAEAARKAAEAAGAEERARLLREAEAAERKAAAAQIKAETREDNASAVVTPVVQVAVKQQGESMRKIWRALVVDVAQVPREYMIVNEKALDGIAKATKGSIQIAGVGFYAENSLAVRK